MSARRTLMQWTVTRSTLVAWISMEHLKFTIRHGFVISGARIEGRHFILTFHHITFECIAHGFTTSMHRRNPTEVIRSMGARSV
jgi:hypothetical protein